MFGISVFDDLFVCLFVSNLLSFFSYTLEVEKSLWA